MKNSAWIFAACGIALLAGLFVLFKPPGPIEAVAPAPTSPTAPVPAAPAPVAVTAVKVFELTVKDGKLESGPEVLQVSEGDEVVLRITVDKADDLHLHGYDLHAHLKPGVPSELSFKASRTGRFEYELHKAHVDLGALEVQPK